jgi:hypothetical protein
VNPVFHAEELDDFIALLFFAGAEDGANLTGGIVVQIVTDFSLPLG